MRRLLQPGILAVLAADFRELVCILIHLTHKLHMLIALDSLDTCSQALPDPQAGPLQRALRIESLFVQCTDACS